MRCTVPREAPSAVPSVPAGKHTPTFHPLQAPLLLLIETDFVFVRPLQGVPDAETLARPIGFRYLNMNAAAAPVRGPFLAVLGLAERWG